MKALASGAACGLVALAAAAQPHLPTGELQLQWEAQPANPHGPLAQARALGPGLGLLPERRPIAQLELKHMLPLPLPPAWPRLALNGSGLLRQEWPAGQGRHDASRVNELNLSAEVGGFGFSAGRRVLGWDVGHAFRPNDVVQQEDRRALAGAPLQGRPLLQLEHFGQDNAASLVWVNPQAWGRTATQAPGGDESALAARGYWRRGALDLHAFARQGHRTGASLGAAAAWVPGESTEWHASLRWLQRHEAWALAPGAGNAVLPSNPWQPTRQGQAAQALLGASWTGTAQQSLLLEAWYDGTAPSARTWRRWAGRNAALPAALGPGQAPRNAVAGNLAWQATPLAGASLRREAVFARASWQPGAWVLWADALWHPADGGLSPSAGLQWQGDRWRLAASLRGYGGPSGALLAQLPQRRQGNVSASLAF